MCFGLLEWVSLGLKLSLGMCEGAGFVGGPIYPIIFASGAMGSALGASSWVTMLGVAYRYPTRQDGMCLFLFVGVHCLSLSCRPSSSSSSSSSCSSFAPSCSCCC